MWARLLLGVPSPPQVWSRSSETCMYTWGVSGESPRAGACGAPSEPQWDAVATSSGPLLDQTLLPQPQCP